MSRWLELLSTPPENPVPPPSVFLAMHITASRWTGGNFLFPATLSLLEDRVIIRRERFIGFAERTIPIGQVASVTASMRLVFGNLLIESSGGLADIVATGFRVAEAAAFRDALQARLASRYTPAAPLPASPMKTCPLCAEQIQLAAIKCRYCGERIA